MPTLTKPIVFERGDRVYMVGPVGVHAPSDAEVAEYAFAKELAKSAPNPNIMWLRGQYVEADLPNLNGQMWTSEELSLKALTPMFMPVTIMHDPRTAVGVIADLAFLTPEQDGVPRSKIDTALAIWAHRFPEAAHEAAENAKQGTLMQSMECISPDYSCSECGMTYVKMPDGYERENWCAHLKGEEGANASRILGNVVFTGTGLIYGTRGAEGADPQAHLAVFEDEVAELHTRWHHDANHTSRSTSHMATISVEQSEYERIQRERDEAKAAAETASAKADEAQAAAEKAEADKAKAESERDEAKTAREAAEEKARSAELRDERMGALGAGFTAKLGEKTKTRLTDQAGKVTDEEWTSRLEELSEAYGVAADADAEGESTEEKTEEGMFSKAEIASAGVGSKSKASANEEPTAHERASVMDGLYS